MTATRTERDETTRTISLSVLEICDVKKALFHRAVKIREPERRHNLYVAVDWLQGLVNGKSLIEEVPLGHRHWVLEGIAQACIEEGLPEIGEDILRQLGGPG